MAGVAALVISAHPGLSAFELGSMLRRTAAKDLDMTPYARTPPASYDPDTSWNVSPIAPFDSGAVQDIGHAGGSADNLTRTWDATTLSTLHAFDDEEAEGSWTLWVRDVAAADRGRLEEWSLEVGKLNRWSLRIQLQATAPALLPGRDPRSACW